jgi:prenyltransferase beta subunit
VSRYEGDSSRIDGLRPFCLKDKVEKLVRPLLGRGMPLHIDDHVRFLQKALEGPLPGVMLALDGQKPWIIYWILQSLSLLGKKPSDLVLNA